MKTFLTIDYKIQIFGFIFIPVAFALYSFIMKEMLVFKAFVWISLLQLVSMIIRLMINHKKDLFFCFYLLFFISFWMFVLYEKSRFKFSYSFESIWLQLSVFSGFIYYFFLFFYPFYLRELSKIKT